MNHRLIPVLASVGAVALGASASAASAAVTVNGAGSTFAAPIYQQIGSVLKGKGITINYQSIGSGAGVAQFTAHTVDFAGTDPAMKLDQMDAAGAKGGPVANIPVAFGAITVSYNVNGVKSGLKLDGATIAKIYLGQITKWNDPAIARQNKGVKLPGTSITVVHRSDSSGTSKGFTNFLSNYSSTWKSQVGFDTVVKWPTGTGAKGNDGVAATVKQTQGAIGYIEQAYALQNHFTFASVKNSKGVYVTPTLDSTSAAGLGLKVPASLRISVIDAPNKAAYPITSQTFLVMHKDLCRGGMDATQAKGMVAFLQYTLGKTGQATIKQLSYAPLPDGLLKKARAGVKALNCGGKPL